MAVHYGKLFKKHPTYREFEHKGVKVCEVWIEWENEEDKANNLKRRKMIWVRDGYEFLIVDGKHNPTVHKDCYLPAESADEETWKGFEERARQEIQTKFDEYWGLQ